MVQYNIQKKEYTDFLYVIDYPFFSTYTLKNQISGEDSWPRENRS